MDSIENNQAGKSERKKRPELLTFLCILTFIGSGLSAFAFFSVYISYDEFISSVDELNLDFPELKMILTGGKRFFLTGFILYTISLYGAIKMWNLKKMGFHFYVGAQVFLLLLPNAMISSYQFSVIGLLVTVAFIIAYATHLKFMN
ncbi:MAG: hypothetical protein JW731_02155 [Bacteroidales bacterium]|nr:hypothetical protein [Bacteroidales bacterium]